MRSIFKKIAFVLALVMIVTTMPAREAAAATTPSLKKSKIVLYIGGDEKEQYADRGYVVPKDKAGYTGLSFASEDTTVVTVNKKTGRLIPQGLGTTKVVATFTKKGAKDVQKECTIIVRQNASKAGIDETSEKALAELVVGEKVTMVSTKTGIVNGESKTVAGSSKDFTSLVRFESSNEEIFTVDRKTGEITPVAPGEAELKVFGVQWEYDKTAKKKMSARIDGSETTYKVKVADKPMEALQTAWDKITLTFGTAAEAETAVNATKPSLNNADAAVTEKWDIIKVYKVLKNSNNSEQTVYIEELGQIDTNKEQVVLTMFDELDQETDYIVRYKDHEMKLSTCKYIANELKIVPIEEKYSVTDTDLKDSSRIWLNFKLYTTGAKNQRVDISGAKKYKDWESSVDVTDLNTTQYHPEYSFDATTRLIWFYTEDVSYRVHVKASFIDWYSVTATTDTSKIAPLVDEAYIGPQSGANNTSYKVTDWGITPNHATGDDAEHIHDFSKAGKVYAAEDIGRKLVVRLNNEDGLRSCDDVSNHFKFVSSNDDKLSINERTGEIYPPKNAMNGYVMVHVYYDDIYAGSVQVQVVAKRYFANFTAKIENTDGTGSTKLSYNSATSDINDTMRLILYPVDQLGEIFDTDMTYKVELNGANSKNYVTLQDNGTEIPFRQDYIVSVPAGTLLTKNISTFTIVCTATYNDGKATPVTKKYPVVFTARDTKEMDARAYKVLVNEKEYDMKEKASLIATISAFSYDKDGYKKEKLDLNPAYQADGGQVVGTAAGIPSVTVRLGNEYMSKDYLTKPADSKDLEFSIVQAKSGYLASVVSGSAISATSGSAITGIELKYYNNLLDKVKVGQYAVSLFIGDGSRNVYRAGTSINVIDKTGKMGWTWRNYSSTINVTNESDVNGVIAAIRNCFEFDKDNAGSKRIYVGYYDKKTGALAVIDDFSLKGNSLYINKVRYLDSIQLNGTTYYFEQELDLKRTVRVNVSD